VAWRHIEGEIVILDLTTSEYLTLNETASVLWERLESWASVEDLTNCLVEAFEVESAVAEPDVLAFLERCNARKFLEELD